MKTLIAGTNVYASGWNEFPYDLCVASFNTARNYRLDDETPEQSHKRCLDNGHATAWTCYSGWAITNSSAEQKRREHEDRIEARSNAVCLEDGEEVIIEGEVFKVLISKNNRKRPYNSDPIHFFKL